MNYGYNIPPPAYYSTPPDLGTQNSPSLTNGISRSMGTNNISFEFNGFPTDVQPPHYCHPYFPHSANINEHGLTYNAVPPNNRINNRPLTFNEVVPSIQPPIQTQQPWIQPFANANGPGFHYNATSTSTSTSNQPFGHNGFFSPCQPTAQYPQPYISTSASSLNSRCCPPTEFLPPSTPNNYRSPGGPRMQRHQKSKMSTTGLSAQAPFRQQTRTTAMNDWQNHQRFPAALSAPPPKGFSGVKFQDMELEENTMMTDQAQLPSRKMRKVEIPGFQGALRQAGSPKSQKETPKYQAKSDQAGRQQIERKTQSELAASRGIQPDFSKGQGPLDDKIRLEKDDMNRRNQHHANKIRLKIPPERESPRPQKKFVAVTRSQEKKDYHAKVHVAIQAQQKEIALKLHKSDPLP